MTARACRPRVIARWRMTANGIALPRIGESAGFEAAHLERDLEQQAALGVAEVTLEGDPELISAALEQRLVDRIVCWIEPAMALDPVAAVTAGLGAAHMDEALRLVAVTFTVEANGDVRVEGDIPRPCA